VDRDNKIDMKRKISFLVLCAMLFALGSPSDAQQAKKVPRIGYLSSVDRTLESTRSDSFRQALRDLGYIEGQSIAVEYKYAEGKVDRFPELMAELVRLKVEIIVVAGGYRVIRSAMNATKTIPLVMTGGGIDPIEAGIVESLARPGGNVTGITNLTRELGGKRLELLKEAVPTVVHIAVLHESANPGSLRELKDVLPVAERIFAALSKDRPDGLYVTTSPLMTANLKRTVGFALKSRLPSVGSNIQYVEAGGLMSYDADPADSYRRVAWYLDKILKGAKPADLPIEQPTKFELVINLKTATQIGVTIPPNVLARADRVIR
jgi:putative tryptophan/tyrosine transport system substrate-binding protein